MNDKVQAESILMTTKRLLNIQMKCKMFTKILKNKILEKNVKYEYFLIMWFADTIYNEKLNPVVTDFFLEAEN